MHYGQRIGMWNSQGRYVAFLLMGFNPREQDVNYLIVNACVKTTEMFICD
jgi:hypothetical protein